ncbi:hypothetical protein [Paraliomyxa miuraensis]|uniref:hypothetical protein n=1 Tax=Paraliomyxa miuraensis TaxID=376150 RepID=UPI00225365F9|nr:hypothetical protein [Paraliomyxa miuraensis]MCX4246741.1 hypothetical protein [Paraliomyxa miuraensis]
MLAGVFIGLACWREDAEHCSYNDGDSSCQARGLGQFCSACESSNHGCVDARPSEDCAATPEEDPASGPGPIGGDGDEESTGGGGPVASECAANAECSGATPFCDTGSGQCVSCEAMAQPDDACAGLSAAASVCGSTGACVQCEGEKASACGGTTPVCDGAANVCVGCSAHDQCGPAACNFFTGACLPEDAVVEVGSGLEFAQLSAALDALGAEGTIIVHAGNYDESIAIDGERTIAFVAPASELPVWWASVGAAPQLTVGAGAAVLMDHIQLSGNVSLAHPGLLVQSGRVWLDRTRVVNNPGGGIELVDGAELTLRNGFVGGDDNDAVALSVEGSDARVIYSTLAAGFGDAAALRCGLGVFVQARNSLFVGRTAADEIQCATALIDHSAMEMDLGGTNQTLGVMPDTSWFQGYGVGDLHLSSMAPSTIGTTAQWQTGEPLDDPPTDIDWDQRPAMAGAADYAGADVP